ncbi:MAG: hypothetical protein M1818_002838 [Claussenomyces sp. TS43310]|nr:MAG: hypothetical protein M1818_002838 [Claussenomyces sp. TS43310]
MPELPRPQQGLFLRGASTEATVSLVHSFILSADNDIFTPRPSNARIMYLEAENGRLQESLSRLRLQLTSEPDEEETRSRSVVASLSRTASSGRSNSNAGVEKSSHSDACHETIVRTERLPGPDSPTARMSFAPDTESRFHGPTSALFDETASGCGQPLSKTNLPKPAEPRVRSHLFGESAKQRQLEIINFASGKLDFDGIDPDLGMHLLDIFWNRQQHFGMMIYRAAFMRDMACAGPYFSKLLLNSIYFAASKYSWRTETRSEPDNTLTTGWVYRRRVVELLSKAFDKSEITTVQALLIMASHSFTWCDERTTSFLYNGLACSMIIDLGLHVDDPTLQTMRVLSDEDLEIRRRTFWGAFVMDKTQSLYQGRPASLREAEINVPITFLDEYEELAQFNELTYTDSASESPIRSPTYSISTLKEECKLSIIMDQILKSLYATNSTGRDPEVLFRESRSLHLDLEHWRRELPPYLDIHASDSTGTTPLPHFLSLLALFNVLIILLHRPFVSDGHLHSTSPSIAFDSFGKCASAASQIGQILRMYRQHFAMKRSPYIISYAAYVSATIFVRIAAQRRPGSEAHTSLRTCIDVLNEHQEQCLAPRRANRVIQSLMKRMGVFLSQDAGPSMIHRDLDPSHLDIQESTQLTPEISGGNSSYDMIAVRDAPLPAIGFDDACLDAIPLDLDLDMDAVVRSFMSQQHNFEQASQPSRDGIQMSPPSSMLPCSINSAGPSTSNGVNDIDLTGYVTNPAVPTSDILFLNDPLFGAFDEQMTYGDGVFQCYLND